MSRCIHMHTLWMVQRTVKCNKIHKFRVHFTRRYGSFASEFSKATAYIHSSTCFRYHTETAHISSLPLLHFRIFVSSRYSFVFFSSVFFSSLVHKMKLNNWKCNHLPWIETHNGFVRKSNFFHLILFSLFTVAYTFIIFLPPWCIESFPCATLLYFFFSFFALINKMKYSSFFISFLVFTAFYTFGAKKIFLQYFLESYFFSRTNLMIFKRKGCFFQKQRDLVF